MVGGGGNGLNDMTRLSVLLLSCRCLATGCDRLRHAVEEGEQWDPLSTLDHEAVTSWATGRAVEIDGVHLALAPHSQGSHGMPG